MASVKIGRLYLIWARRRGEGIYVGVDGGGRIRKGVWRRRHGGVMDEGGWGRGYGGGSMEEGVWERWDGGGRGYKGGGFSLMKYEISRMKHVEHDSTIGNNVKNGDSI